MEIYLSNSHLGPLYRCWNWKLSVYLCSSSTNAIVMFDIDSILHNRRCSTQAVGVLAKGCAQRIPKEHMNDITQKTQVNLCVWLLEVTHPTRTKICRPNYRRKCADSHAWVILSLRCMDFRYINEMKMKMPSDHHIVWPCCMAPTQTEMRGVQWVMCVIIVWDQQSWCINVYSHHHRMGNEALVSRLKSVLEKRKIAPTFHIWIMYKLQSEYWAPAAGLYCMFIRCTRNISRISLLELKWSIQGKWKFDSDSISSRQMRTTAVICYRCKFNPWVVFSFYSRFCINI